MDNNEIEKKFFTYLQKQFSKNDLIKLGSSFVPYNSPNGVNRFYSSNDSIWFSRLNSSENKKIYYFGIMDSIKPKAIITYNNDRSKSLIRFTQDEEVYIRIQVDLDKIKEIKQLFTLKYATKDKSSNYYFLDLGKINTPNLINNVNTLIKNFVFRVSLKNKALLIEKYINAQTRVEIGEVIDKKNYIAVLKTNLFIIQIKNTILKRNFPYVIEKRLDKYLFRETTDSNYQFNPKFKNKFNLSDEEIFKQLNYSISNIDNSVSYESIIERIALDLKSIDNLYHQTESRVHDTFSGIEKMNNVINDVKRRNLDFESSEMEEIPESNVEASINKNEVHPFNKLKNIINKRIQPKTQYGQNHNNKIFNKYMNQTNILKEKFELNVENIRNLIEKRFPGPQITNVKFNDVIDECCHIFTQRVNVINEIVNSTTEYSEVLENEIKYNIEVLEEINERSTLLIDELLLNMSEVNCGDEKNVLNEIDRLTNSIKDYK